MTKRVRVYGRGNGMGTDACSDKKVPDDYQLGERERFLEDEPSSVGRVALFAVCVAFILEGVFYWLNNGKIEPAKPQCPEGYICTKIP
ncbi:MAG TPA: hypothetical protein VN665_02545 [Candidatus Paceibacterota bacterium]|nr:hypothetical protein [Candidatus Paceibacterota bacterium]